MKTAEEWKTYFESEPVKELLKSLSDNDMWQFICQQIQLDAMKEGARRAAKIGHDAHDPCTECSMGQESEEAILTTANNWTKEDLKLSPISLPQNEAARICDV